MSALDTKPRTMEQAAAELDAKIAEEREAVEHHQRLARFHEEYLEELRERQLALWDAMSARDEAKWRNR